MPNTTPAPSRPPTFSPRAVFWEWEKLRVVYNLVLIAAVLLSAAPSFALFADPRFYILLGGGAVIANVCYFAGPTVEAYVLWLGGRTLVLRYVLFVAGTVFATLLAVNAVFVHTALPKNPDWWPPPG